MPTQVARRQIQDGAIDNSKQSFGTPSVSTDVSTKGYTDTAIATALGSINLKDAVLVATVVAGTLATSFANGQAVDGVTLTTGDRILIKNQSTGSENGIYTVNASGAPTRAVDCDVNSEMEDAVVWVSKGTANADTQWKMVTDGPITI
jgi:phage-related tail fiber protein